MDLSELDRAANWIHNNLDGADCGILTTYIDRRRKALLSKQPPKRIAPSKRVAQRSYSLPVRYLRAEDEVGNQHQINAALTDLIVFGNAYIGVKGQR